MSVRRHLALSRRVARGAAPAGRYGLGSRVSVAREPKLLRESTRLAAARTRVALVAPAVAAADVLAAPAPVSFPPERLEGLPTAPAPAPSLMRAPAPAPRSTPAPGPQAPREETGSMLKFLPEQPVEPSAPTRPVSAQPPRPTVSRAPRSTPASPSTPVSPSTPAPAAEGIREETGNYSEFLPRRSAESPAPPRPTLARAPASARSPAPPQSGPRPLSRSADSSPPTPAPASGPQVITPESLGIGPASFEWLFGDPDKALAHPDVTAGPVVSLPPLTPQQRSARRVARLTARGGSPYGRGARISEGPAKAPEATAPAPVVHVDSAVAPDSAGPELPAPSPVGEAPAAAVQRAARDEASERHPSPPPMPASNATPPVPPPAPSATPPAPPRPARQRLVAGRRPVTEPGRELARATVDRVPVPTSQPAPAPTSQPAPSPTPAATAPPRTPPPPPSPGPPPVRPIGSPRPTPARPQIVRPRATPPGRPTIHRAPRPTDTPAASAPLAGPRSLLRRALAALTQRSRAGQTPADGDRVDKYVTPAPSVRPEAQVARMARADRPTVRPTARVARPETPPPRPEQPAPRPLARLASASPPSSPSPQPWTPPDDVAPRALSPQPPMRAPAEPSSQQLSRAPAPGVSPKSHETTPSRTYRPRPGLPRPPHPCA